MSIYGNATDDCFACEKRCLRLAGGVCNKNFGIVTAWLFLVLYTIYTVWIVVRLGILHKLHYHWNLKKVIFLVILFGTLSRVIKYSLMLGGELTLTYYFLDGLFYYEGFVAYFVGYFLLLSFWAGIIRKHGASVGWFSSKMRRIVIVFTIITIVIMTTIPIVDSYAPVSLSFWPSLINGIVLVYLLILSISSIVKSVQVLRLIRSFSIKDKSIMRAVTLITTASSAAMVVSMVVLGILTLLIVRSSNFYVCQSGFVVFALLEFLVATSIIAPLSRTKREFSSSTELPTSIHDSISYK